MANVATNSTIGVPGVDDNFGDAVEIAVNGAGTTLVAHTGVRSDLNTTFPNQTGINLTIQDGVLITREFTLSAGSGSNRTAQTSDTVFNGTNSRVHFTAVSGADVQTPWYGHHNWNGHTFQMDTPDNTVRYILGGIAGNWGFTVGPLGVNFVNYSSSQLILHGGGMNGNQIFVNGPIRLLGNSFSQNSASVNLFGVGPSNVADAEAFDNGGTYNSVNYGYSWRIAHQAGLADGINLIDAGTGGRVALYTNFDLTEIVRSGSIAYQDAGTTSNSARQSCLQLNNSVAWWMIDPIFNNGTGEDNDLLLGFHTSQRPGVSGSATDSEIRMFVSDKPVFRDAATGGLVAGDFKVRYEEAVRILPDDWDSNTVPTEETNNDIIVSQTVDTADFNGVIILDQRVRYGTGTDSSSTTSTDDRDPSNNTYVTPTSHSRIAVRAFDYDYAYTSDAQPKSTGQGATGLVDLVETRLDGSNLAAFLNSRTALTAVVSGLTDFADVYASIRRHFFDGAPKDLMPLTGSGSTITFDRNTNIATSGDSAYVANLITLGSTSSLTDLSLTGDVTTFNFGANACQWNSKQLPSGVTIQGGTHNGLNAVISNGTYTVAGTLTLNINTASGTYLGLDTLLGSISYAGGSDVTISSSNNVTVQIAEADIPANISFTPGSNSIGNNITRADVPVPVVAIVDTVIIPAHATVDGFYEIEVIKGVGNTETITTNIPTGSHTLNSGTSLSFDLSDQDGWEDGDGMRISIKYNSAIATSEKLVFQENKGLYAWNQSTSVVPLPTQVANALVGLATVPSSAVNVVAFVSADNRALVTISASTVRESAAESLGLAIQIANTEAYFDSYVNDAETTPVTTYQSNNGVSWNDDTRVFFQAGDFRTITVGGNSLSGVPDNQLLTNWSGIPSDARGVGAEVQSIAALNATLAQVQEAGGLGVASELDARGVTERNQAAQIRPQGFTREDGTTIFDVAQL